jgi:hypothetical protein
VARHRRGNNYRDAITVGILGVLTFLLAAAGLLVETRTALVWAGNGGGMIIAVGEMILAGMILQKDKNKS